jgi:DNA modification methylase
MKDEVVNRVVKVAGLTPHPRNYNTHSDAQVGDLRASLKRFGQVRSIVVQGRQDVGAPGGDPKFLIVAGHGLVAAARLEGYTQLRADVIPAAWKPARVLAYLAADNELARQGNPDEAQLAAIVAELAAANETELARLAAGNAARLKELLAANALATTATGDAEPQIDRAEELNEKWKVKPGDLWRIGDHRLLCGDSTKRDDVERVMQGDKAAFVSDPPYGIDVDTSWLSALHVKRGKPSNKSDDRLANDDGTLDLSWAYKYHEWLVFGFPFVARDEKYTGLLVWDKRGDGGENGLGNPVEVAASNAFNGYRLARHVWAGYVREAGEKREAHPTQKPIGVMLDAIKLIKSQIILDPFIGSGTTIIACQNLQRKCRAIEIAPAYCAVTLERMATAFPGIEIERLNDNGKQKDTRRKAGKKG